jgi:hypothetical protein
MASKKTQTSHAWPGFARRPWREAVHPAFVRRWALERESRSLSKIENEKEFTQNFNEWYGEAKAAGLTLDEAFNH